MLPRVQRFVRLRPSSLWRPDPAETERLLGAAIERVRTLGATAVVIDAVEPGPDGHPAAWFPTRSDTRPRRRLPAVRVAIPDARGRARVRRGCPRRRSTSTTPSSRASAATSASSPPWTVFSSRRSARWSGLETSAPARGGRSTSARRAIDAAQLPRRERRALTCFRAVERELPGLQLALVTRYSRSARPWRGRGPHAGADGIQILARPAARSRRWSRAGWLAPRSARRVGLWLEGDRPPADRDLMAITRRFQREGGTALGWSRDDPVADRPRAAVVAPVVSSSIFPVRF